jgi:hypothetical protein
LQGHDADGTTGSYPGIHRPYSYYYNLLLRLKTIKSTP